MNTSNFCDNESDKEQRNSAAHFFLYFQAFGAKNNESNEIFLVRFKTQFREENKYKTLKTQL